MNRPPLLKCGSSACKLNGLPRVTINVICIFKPLSRKPPENIILHIGTNESVNEPSRVILGKLLGLRKLLKKDFTGK